MEGGSVLCQRHPSEHGQILKRHRGGCSPSESGARTNNPLDLAQSPTGRALAVSLSLSFSL